MGSPLAGAAAGDKGRAWALLLRSPVFVDTDELPSGADYSVNCAAPPSLSTLFLSRARALLAVGGDPQELVGRVQCVDGEGNILVAVWSEADEQGTPSSPPQLLVCRPGRGSVDIVPPIPEEVGVLEAAMLGGIGIVPGPGGRRRYLVTVLLGGSAAGSSPSSSSSSDQSAGASPAARGWADQRTGASSAARGRADQSSGASSAARVLVYCSSSSSWTTKEVCRPPRFRASSDDDEGTWAIVKGEEQEQAPPFQPDGVLCDEVMNQLVFVDAMRGLVLVFDPQNADMTRFVAFPVFEAEDEGLGLQELEEEEVGHCYYGMAYSEGSVRLLQSAAGSIRVRHLQGDGWHKDYSISVDEILCCNSSIRLAELLSLRAVDPVDCYKISFGGVMSGRAQDEHSCCLAITVSVDPKKPFSERVKFVAKADDATTSATSWSDTVVWWFHPSSAVARAAVAAGRASAAARCSQWMRKLSHKRLGDIARSTITTARKHLHRVQPWADFAGSAAEYAGFPFGSMISPTFAKIIKINEVANAGEELLEWCRKPSPRPKNFWDVGTKEEARTAIDVWVEAGKPETMKARPAPGLSQEQLQLLSDLFKRHGAEKLLLLQPSTTHNEESSYCVVPSAAPYFPPPV